MNDGLCIRWESLELTNSSEYNQAMKFEDLKNISNEKEFESNHLRALWYDLKGDWDEAHSIVQVMFDVEAMWIHAYLHRKEPDEWNAKYWYRRAGKPFPGNMDFDLEAAVILENLI